MASPDIEAVFNDDYVPPHMWFNTNEDPVKRHRKRRNLVWCAELRCWVLDNCSLLYKGSGRPLTPKYPVPEVAKNRW